MKKKNEKFVTNRVSAKICEFSVCFNEISTRTHLLSASYASHLIVSLRSDKTIYLRNSICEQWFFLLIVQSELISRKGLT